MIEIFRRMFPGGIECGSGIACSASPFSATLILDFYDGATEGFARIGATNNVIYFRKVWWDEYQNNRLFDGFVFRADELKRLDEELFEFIDRGLATTDSAGPVAKGRELPPANLFEAVQKLSVLRVNLFCVQVVRELFILPVTD